MAVLIAQSIIAVLSASLLIWVFRVSTGKIGSNEIDYFVDRRDLSFVEGSDIYEMDRYFESVKAGAAE